MKYKVLFYFVVMLLLFGCKGNSIYFDLGNKSIITCQGNRITSFNIESDDNNDLYFFKCKDFEYANDYFSFQSLNKYFLIEKSNKTIPLDSFYLQPNKGYKISNTSIGDAADGTIEITTDSLANIISASKTACK